MSTRRITAIWYRGLQRGEFFNIERGSGLVVGGGGSLYIEIPKSLVGPTLRFFAYQAPQLGDGGFDIAAIPTGSNDGVAYPINVQVKAGGRMRITNQNRQAASGRRHPAWSRQAGFPEAPNGVRNRDEAAQHLPEGGVRIFVAKVNDGTFIAGFTKGTVPSNIPLDSPLRPLWMNSGVGGVISDLDMPVGGGI